MKIDLWMSYVFLYVVYWLNFISLGSDSMGATFFALDTETTGLNPETDEILSIAMILLDSSFTPLSEKVVYAFPEGDVSPKAAEINGYTRETWVGKGAVSQIVLFTEIYEFIKAHHNLIPIGHNVKFDLGFLSTLFARNKSSDLGRHVSYHSMDTVGISIFFDMVLFGKKHTSYSLVALCDRFGIQLHNAHDALADIKATLGLFKYLYTSLGGIEKRAAVPPPIVFSRMLIKKGSMWMINRGRHKGQALIAVAADTPDYLQWMLSTLDDLSEEQRTAVETALRTPGS